MRLVVTVLIVLFVLSLGALEILAVRGVSDADVPGGASTAVLRGGGASTHPWLSP